jgi:hypothetical protein
LRVGQPRLVTAQQPLVIQTLAPGQAIAVQVTASSEATSTAFLAKRSRGKGHDVHSEARVDLPLPQVERLAQETQPAVRIRVHDATLPPSLRDLQSGYYEAEFESIFNR